MQLVKYVCCVVIITGTLRQRILPTKSAQLQHGDATIQPLNGDLMVRKNKNCYFAKFASCAYMV